MKLYFALYSIALMGLLVPEAHGKNVWGSRQNDKKQQKKTQFERINENFQKMDADVSDGEYSPNLSDLLEMVMNGGVNGLDLVIRAVTSINDQFRSEETKHFFSNLNIKQLMDSITDALGEGDDWTNTEFLSQLLTVSGRDLHSQGEMIMSQALSVLDRLQGAIGKKRKLAKIMEEVPEDLRPILSMILELDESAIRSLLAGALSSLTPMEQLMVNRIMSGDVSGFLSLWKQYLKQDGEVERVREWVLPFRSQLPDPFQNLLDDKVGFENYVFEVLEAASAIGKTADNKRKEL